jgi:hypothetical protein
MIDPGFFSRITRHPARLRRATSYPIRPAIAFAAVRRNSPDVRETLGCVIIEAGGLGVLPSISGLEETGASG